MGYNKCSICGEYHWSDSGCADIFKVFHEDYLGDDSKDLYAWNFDGAAIKYADYYNTRCDYILMNGETIQVFIEDSKGVRKKYSLSAEPSIHYTVDEIQ